MLKIKNNVDLEELKKFRFGTVIEQEVGKPETAKLVYYQRLDAKWFEKRISYKRVRVYLDKTIHFFNRYEEVYGKHWADDLIQAGLVEKVGEDE